MLENLRALAAISLREGPDEASVLEACDIVRRGLSARAAYVLRAGDPHFLKLGSQDDPEQYDVKQRGYWLMWQELARRPEIAAGLARVRDRLVHDAVPLAAGAQGNYLSMILPGQESTSEMLVIERASDAPVSEEEQAFVEMARAILSRLAERVLDTERRERQRRQLSALADIARAFNTSHDKEAALTDLATAIARASGYDFVNVLIYDEALENVVEQGLNLARHSNTQTASMVRGESLRRHFGRDLYGPLPRRMRRGIPLLVPDVFAPNAVPESLRAFYERAHVNSIAWFPMVFQDRVLGTVDFTSSIKRDFGEAEVGFLKGLADQAATAVKGMILYRDLEQSRAEILRYAEKLEEASRAEHFLARTDAVTGIPNRRYLEEVLRAEAARSSRRNIPISVVMADLDHFKAINDSFGHPVGDEALRFVSNVARACSRESDFVGRWGGDEFLFILPETSAEAAFVLAERFRRELASRPFHTEEGDFSLVIPVSAGIADAIPPPDANPEVLVSRADKALYRAKAGGRDQVRHWSEAYAA